MEKIQLKVVLPKNRDSAGSLIFITNGRPIARYKVLGRGSKGIGDTSMQKNGNTPTGEYDGNFIVDTSKWPQNSYGPNGAIRMEPIAGNAKTAMDKGRKGLLIHGGSLGSSGYWRGKNSLRATHGCLRMSNDNVKDLIQRINAIRYSEERQMCMKTTIRVTVVEP